MTAKGYLQTLRRLSCIIRQKQDELRDLRANMDCLGSFDYSKPCVQSSTATEANFTKVVEQINKLDEELSKDIENFIKERHEIIQRIQSLDNALYIDILYKRYVEFKRFELIAAEMNYSYRQIKRIHKMALKEIEKMSPYVPF